MSSLLSSSSEANASELLESIEEMFLWYVHIVIYLAYFNRIPQCYPLR